jgi:hypothetical protein
MMRDAVRVQKKRVKLAPKGNSQRGASMFDLGVTLLHSGSMFDSLSELSEAVAVLESVKNSPDASVEPVGVLSALGNARIQRFLRVTKSKDAELAAGLREHEDAMAALQAGDPNALTYLSDFGAVLMRAYERTGESRLLDASVEAQRRAASLTPHGHARQAERLNNLVFALIALNESSGDPGVLDEAISTSRSAVGAVNPEHLNRASCLYGLACGLLRRGELRRTLLDLDEAAVRASEAVEATPEGHANLATRLALCAHALCFLPSVAKLEKASEDLTLATTRLRHDDPNRALVESNHGALLDALVGFLGDAGPEPRHRARQAVQLTRKAVDATPLQHSEYHGRLLNYVSASVTLASLDHDPAVLDDPLRRCSYIAERAGTGLPEALLGLGRSAALACRHDLTGEDGLALEAIGGYQRAASDSRLAVFRRLDAARAGVGLAARCGETGRGLELFALAIDLLDSAAWRGIERRDQERLLAQYAGLPSEAASAAITAGRPETAVEFLERGRGVLLDRLLDDIADLAQLNEIDPDRARQFETTRHDLEAIVIPDLEADSFDFPLRPPQQPSEADQRSVLARQIDGLISEIRAIPGCGGLFQPPCLPDLRKAMGARSAAIINISTSRCDAIVVTASRVTVTPMPGLTRENAERAAEFFRSRAQQAPRQDRVGEETRKELARQLAWLWDTVTEPILRDLGITGGAPADAEAPRLYWCPAGPAAFLPVHAAGRHSGPASSAPDSVIDRVESVYIPKLRVLAEPEPHSADQQTSQPPVIVSMPATPGWPPLRTAETEARQLLGIFPGAAYLTEGDATCDAVLAAMSAHSWFHFAVHGVTDEHTPVAGGLQLADGRLTVRELAQLRLPDARFAYLSACATYQGSPAIPDETITVGTALCIAGCRHVIAALWPVADEHASEFARRTYEILVTTTAETPVLHPDNAARAVRQTARTLRDLYPGQPERWAAFICASRS